MIVRSIGELLEGRTLITIAPEDTIDAACGVLDRHNIGALPVMEGEKLLGILSERDVIRRCNAKGCDAAQSRVKDMMTRDVDVVHLSESVATALQMMLDGGFRHLPVMDRVGSVVGMLSLRDIPTEYRLMVERFNEYRSSNAVA